MNHEQAIAEVRAYADEIAELQQNSDKLAQIRDAMTKAGGTLLVVSGASFVVSEVSDMVADSVESGVSLHHTTEAAVVQTASEVSEVAHDVGIGFGVFGAGVLFFAGAAAIGKRYVDSMRTNSERRVRKDIEQSRLVRDTVLQF